MSSYTKILTKDGYVPISQLKDQQVIIWNGFEWSEVTVRQIGTNSELLRIKFTNGSVLDCAPEHKFHINVKFYMTTSNDARPYANADGFITEKIEAKDLKRGHSLIAHHLPDRSNADYPFEQVVSVESISGYHDIYGFVEPKLGLGTFEGIVACS